MSTIKAIIESNPVLETILTDKKTYQSWIKADKEIAEYAKEQKEAKSDVIKAIARELKRNPDAYLSTFKSSVSRAKLALGLRKVKKSAGRSAVVIVNVESVIEFVSKAGREDVTAILTACKTALKAYDKVNKAEGDKIAA